MSYLYQQLVTFVSISDSCILRLISEYQMTSFSAAYILTHKHTLISFTAFPIAPFARLPASIINVIYYSNDGGTNYAVTIHPPTSGVTGGLTRPHATMD